MITIIAMSIIGFILGFLHKKRKQKTYIIEDCIVSSIAGMFYGAIIGLILASLITVVFGEIIYFSIPLEDLIK